MPAPTWAFDLQGVRALAHKLYCSCKLLTHNSNTPVEPNTQPGQEPTSIYRPLARSVRTLRNKLEEADEALDDASVRPEDIRVLLAAGESRDVLNRLERSLHRRRSAVVKADDVGGDVVADLLNDIDEVTSRLSHALEALDHLGGTGRIPHNFTGSGSAGTQTPRSSSILTSSSDDGNKMSAGSSSWSFGSRPTSLSHRQSVDNERAPVYGLEDEKQVVAPRTASSPPVPFDGFKRKLPVIRTEHQAMQFAYFDPMSVDIDSASSLILSGQPSQHKDLLPAVPPRSSARVAKSPIEKAAAPLIAATKNRQDMLAQENNGSIGRSTSLRSATLPAQAAKISSLSSSNSLRFSQRSPSIRTNRDAHNGSPHHHRSSPVAPLAEEEDSEQIPAEAPGHHTTELRLNETRTTTSYRLIPIRPPARILSHSTPAVKSRYRVVNSEEAAQGLGPFALPDAQSPLSSPVSPRRAIRWASEPKTRHVSELGVTRTQSDQEIIAESKLNEDFASAIISSWNAGLWDQAKHNIELHLSRYSESRDDGLNRRLHHMLGAIASLKGEPEQALLHFISVFSSPVEESCQLDAGHCAAAYWMGDIYALLNRRTEALLAYSIASRNPLLQDAKWLPMYQQILAERETCRRGETKTGVNIDWQDTQDDKPKTADSILDPKVLARDVARSLIQADTQPVSFSRKLDPNRSRAMAFHDLGLQPGSWQDKHALPLEATALEPSGPWPLPFDPFFALGNVQQHRLLGGPEIDLLQAGLSATKLPKKRRLGFSCPDLRWLILTLRKCLAKLDMAWSEVMIGQSPRFVVRYAVPEAGVVKTHLFSVPVYRLSFRPGYGVDICSDGICSSRIKAVVPKTERGGVHGDEVKRVKRMVREFLETAAKRDEAMESKASASSPAMRLMV